MITDCGKTVKKLMQQVDGKCGATAMTYLCELAQSLSDVPGFFVDLGTYQGRSAMVLTLASMGDKQRRRIISIDNYLEGTSAREPEAGGQPDFWILQARFKCRGRVYLVMGDTAEVPPPVVGQEIALVFVDADHNRDGLTRDIETWKPLVRPGGLMAFDDYGSTNWPDVKPTVDELMSDWTRLEQKGSVIAFRR